MQKSMSLKYEPSSEPLNAQHWTLRQVLYPHDSDEMRSSGRRDEDILHLLAKVKSVLPSLKISLANC